MSMHVWIVLIALIIAVEVFFQQSLNGGQLNISHHIKKIVNSGMFNSLFIGLIIFVSILMGLQTYPSITARWGSVINVIDNIILGLFVVEIALRILAEGRKPWKYFSDPWNAFDFTIVLLCIRPMHTKFAAVLRLVRILRALRLVKAMPETQMIVNGLIKSLSSIGSVSLLLFIHFYIFAVIGVSYYQQASPKYFGTLQETFLTLFGIVTLEGWINVMDEVRANVSGAGPVLYFVLFIIIGTMIIMNLFIGIIVGGMSDAREEAARERDAIVKKDIRTVLGELDQLHQDMAGMHKRFGELKARIVAHDHAAALEDKVSAK
jgi:voltage-gated sodium channel